MITLLAASGGAGPASETSANALPIILAIFLFCFLILPQMKNVKKSVANNEELFGNKTVYLIFNLTEAFFLIVSFITLIADVFKWKFLDGMSSVFSYYEASNALDYFGHKNDFQLFQVLVIIFWVFSLLLCILSAAAQYLIKSPKAIILINGLKVAAFTVSLIFFMNSVSEITGSGYILTGLFALPCIALGVIIVLMISESVVAHKVGKSGAKNVPQSFTPVQNHPGNFAYQPEQSPVQPTAQTVAAQTVVQPAAQTVIQPDNYAHQVKPNALSISVQKLGEISFCDKCDDIPDQLFKVTISQGDKSVSYSLCKNCALKIKQQVDAQNRKNQ